MLCREMCLCRSCYIYSNLSEQSDAYNVVSLSCTKNWICQQSSELISVHFSLFLLIINLSCSSFDDIRVATKIHSSSGFFIFLLTQVSIKTAGFLDFLHCLEFQKREHNASGTGYAPGFRQKGGKVPIHMGRLESFNHWTCSRQTPSHLRMRTGSIPEKCFLLLRIPDDGQSPETSSSNCNLQLSETFIIDKCHHCITAGPSVITVFCIIGAAQHKCHCCVVPDRLHCAVVRALITYI